MASVATMYALAGGITSIIWTDVVQFVVMIAAVLAAVIILWCRIPADTAVIWHALSTTVVDDGSKLRLLDLSLDLTRENTLFTALSGYLLLNLAAYGTDQDLAQRMLTCRNAVAGGRSAFIAILFNLPVLILFLCLGLMLFIFYHPELVGGAALATVPEAKYAFLTFILHEMPPGLGGLMLAGLFAITLTSMLSAINAMASSFITDCYRRAVVGRDERHYLRASRWAVIGAGTAVALMAMVCITWHRSTELNLLGFAFNAVVLTATGLLGIFLAALCTRRGAGWSAIAALVAAFAVTLALQPNLAKGWAPEHWATLAWPWRMVIGTVVSFGVCCLGSRREASV
jgi:Na+/proline symporter